MARSIVVFAENAGQGKTILAVGLAERLQNAGHDILLVRVGDADDRAAAADAAFFGTLSYGAGDTHLGLTQAASMVGDLDGSVLVAEISPSLQPATASGKLDAIAVSANKPSEATRAQLGDKYRGWVSFAEDDSSALAVVPEDPILMAPVIQEALAALPRESSVRFLGEDRSELCELITIAPISHDTGRSYFALDGKSVTVCRDDKPELALAALAGDTALLVVTGGDEPLGYVAERAGAAGIPLVVTPESTVATVRRLEETFQRRPLRHARQAKRAAALVAGIDLDSLLG